MIYIADDTETNRDLYEALLVDFTVKTFENGMLLVEEFKKKTPRLVILDYTMPVMDGLQTFREIRKMNKTIPVIMMSAFGVGKFRQEALDLGVYDLLSLPIRSEDFVDTIKVIHNKITSLDKLKNLTNNLPSYGE